MYLHTSLGWFDHMEPFSTTLSQGEGGNMVCMYARRGGSITLNLP